MQTGLQESGGFSTLLPSETLLYIKGNVLRNNSHKDCSESFNLFFESLTPDDPRDLRYIIVIAAGVLQTSLKKNWSNSLRSVDFQFLVSGRACSIQFTLLITPDIKV
jgi:hypothetical protein